MSDGPAPSKRRNPWIWISAVLAIVAIQAQQAGNETEKAQAEADQAQAELEAAESRAIVARDCARAYLAAIGELFEGESPEEQADAVRDELQGITAQCEDAFAGS